ncbi:transcription termination factor NusG [Clostridiaceae bacterium]|nr:transcription termination factor NusG [Clostridiaceae bacterium]
MGWGRDMWYVIQTITGKEQELADVIGKIMAGEGQKYERCFVIYQECVQRRKGRRESYVETLFPSYVFVETNQPEEFFLELKQVPRVANFLQVDGCFWNIYEEEEEFLRRMLEGGFDKTRNRIGKDSDQAFIIRSSLVWVNADGQIQGAEGVLGFYLDKIVKQRLRKRSVVIEIPFGGRMRRIRLGIRLDGDFSVAE